jgi:uncharacterized glyoxalase superfamily protein PhnB
MKHTKFVVSSFENRNGTTSWRVDGYFNGVRIRRNFRTREEAAAEQTALEIKALNAANGLHTIATVLTAEQVREAEAVFHRLAGSARPLSFYVDFTLANYREPAKQKSLADGITHYVAAKEAEFNEGHITHAQLRRIKSELLRLQDHFPQKSMAEISSAALIDHLERIGGMLVLTTRS